MIVHGCENVTTLLSIDIGLDCVKKEILSNVDIGLRVLYNVKNNS